MLAATLKEHQFLLWVLCPYITSSIVLQLLGSIIPYFEKLRKEGAEGQKKLTQITRYGTIIIGTFNAIGIAVFLQSMPNVVHSPGVLFTFTTVVTMVTGTMVIMWLGEQITENGIGNGISLIIFAGIIARYPQGFIQMFQMVKTGTMQYLTAIIVAALMIAITGAVILVTEAIRKINVQYAKRVIGRKIYGGQSTHIPLRVNSAGVIPIIFAQSVIMFPRTFATFVPNSAVSEFITRTLSPGHALYTVLYMGLIIFFAYFYTAIAMNPVEMAENMKKHGGYIPGILPGKNTANYINNILIRITLQVQSSLLSLQ